MPEQLALTRRAHSRVPVQPAMKETDLLVQVCSVVYLGGTWCDAPPLARP